MRPHAPGPIKAHGCQAGLVFNPAAPLDALDWVIDDIDLILIMSVNPGFGGQSFIDVGPEARSSSRASASMQSGRDIRLEVDGGIKADNIARRGRGRRRHLRGRQRHLQRKGLRRRHHRHAQAAGGRRQRLIFPLL